MECYFCKRDKSEFNKIFSSLIEYLEKKIHELENRISDKKENCRREYGFTIENFEKVKKIKMNFPISYFRLKHEELIQVEGDLRLLYSYLTEHNSKISDTDDDLKTLINQYLKEPTEERLYPYIKEYEDKKEKILHDIEQIQNNLNYHKIENEESNIISEIEKDIMLNIISENTYYFEFNKDKNEPKSILLCPFCFNLYKMFELSKKINRDMLQKELETLRRKNEDNTSFRDCGY